MIVVAPECENCADPAATLATLMGPAAWLVCVLIKNTAAAAAANRCLRRNRKSEPDVCWILDGVDRMRFMAAFPRTSITDLKEEIKLARSR